MKPVIQTEFFPGGNCFTACLASILELSLDEMPPIEKGDWFVPVHNFLRPRGLAIIQVPFCHVNYLIVHDNLYYIASGRSPRHKCLHAVVYCMEELVHDPHPEGGGILGEPLTLQFIVQTKSTTEPIFGEGG